VHCLPVPPGGIPLLIGGMSRHALRRAALAGGWLGQYALDTMSERDVAAAVAAMRHEGEAAGRNAAQLRDLRVVVRVTGAADRIDVLSSRLGPLAEAGVTEVIVDVDWNDESGPARSLEKLRAPATRV